MAIPLRTKVSIILSMIKEPKVFKFLISQRHAGYLYTQGWFNSFKSNSPVDKNNKPIPLKQFVNNNYRLSKQNPLVLVQRKGGREGGLGRLASIGEIMEIKSYSKKR